jgi:hypothetical protein
MIYIDKIDVLELVKQIKEEQEKITESNEYISWYNDVTKIEIFQPCKITYNHCKENLPKQRIRMVELENELDKLLDDLVENSI